MRKSVFTALAIALPFSALAADSYTVDPAHTYPHFSVNHLGFSTMQGRFDKTSGKITLDRAAKNGSVEIAIDSASVSTGLAKRDEHLRSPDFFDAAKYPTITFKSTRVAPAGNDLYNVTGTFTMHGVSKEITLPVRYLGLIKDPWGNQRAGFELATTLNRKDFGIVWNQTLDTGGLMLGEDVDITINLEVTKAKPEAAKASS